MGAWLEILGQLVFTKTEVSTVRSQENFSLQFYFDPIFNILFFSRESRSSYQRNYRDQRIWGISSGRLLFFAWFSFFLRCLKGVSRKRRKRWFNGKISHKNSAWWFSDLQSMCATHNVLRFPYQRRLKNPLNNFVTAILVCDLIRSCSHNIVQCAQNKSCVPKIILLISILVLGRVKRKLGNSSFSSSCW